jgi:hypothetical protein
VIVEEKFSQDKILCLDAHLRNTVAKAWDYVSICTCVRSRSYYKRKRAAFCGPFPAAKAAFVTLDQHGLLHMQG